MRSAVVVCAQAQGGIVVPMTGARPAASTPTRGSSTRDIRTRPGEAEGVYDQGHYSECECGQGDYHQGHRSRYGLGSGVYHQGHAVTAD
jgi:hypothetical protein